MVDVAPVNTLVDLVARPSGAGAVPARVDDDRGDLELSVAEQALRRLALTPGEEVMLRWTTDGGACAQRARYVGPREGPLGGCVVRPVDEPVATQRRAAFRVDLDLMVDLAVDGVWLPARLVDLSATGARLHLRHDVPPPSGTRLQLMFTLDDEVVALHAAVVRRRDHGSGGATVGVRFDGVRPREDERVQRFLVGRQVRRRPR